MNKIEKITADVLRISRALRSVAPQTEIITVEEALAVLADAEKHLNPERPLAGLVHILKFDIIEGNTRWRSNEDASKTKSASIHKLTAGNGKDM